MRVGCSAPFDCQYSTTLLKVSYNSRSALPSPEKSPKPLSTTLPPGLRNDATEFKAKEVMNQAAISPVMALRQIKAGVVPAPLRREVPTGSQPEAGETTYEVCKTKRNDPVFFQK